MNNNKEKNIILYMCNWGPHVAFQDLCDMRADIPQEIKMIRIPCSGRITKSLLFKAFEMGADGVLLVGCKSGTCRYGKGTLSAKKNTQDARELLELSGIGEERLQLATFLPDESEMLLKFLKDFCNKINEMGQSPIKSEKVDIKTDIIQNEITQILKKHNIYECQDCGKCSSACPLALAGKPFSPRAIANRLIASDIYSESIQQDIFSCLTCGVCYDRCPSDVKFPEFIRDVRYLLRKNGIISQEAHGGFFQSLMRTMTSPDLKTKHWKTLPDNIKTDKESRIVYFGGCSPYFDIFFRNHISVETYNILIDSLKLLNFFDIKPALLENEKCCGHDLLWSGDCDNFLKLAKLNTDALNNMNIDTIVTSCPECYHTFAHDYPEHGFKLNAKILHIYELLETEIDKGAVELKENNRKMIFQESCRLLRLENKKESLEKLIKHFKYGSFIDLPNSINASVCCGNCAWTGCDSFSKALQVKRLKQLKSSNADLLVTSCPKCQIHLKCAMENIFLGDELQIEMKDLTSVISQTIYWK